MIAPCFERGESGSMVKLWHNCGKTVPIFHKQTEVGYRLTAGLTGQRNEGRATLSLHASEIDYNDLRQCAC